MAIIKDMVSAGVQVHRAEVINGSHAFGLTAAGTSSQANSLAVTASFNQISTCAANNGVRLPVGSKNDVLWLRNDGAAACQVYPPVGGALNGGSANAKDATDLINTAGAASNQSSRRAYICTSASGLNWSLF